MAFKKMSYHFLKSNYKRIIISHDPIIDSDARIVIYDGPGDRSPRLLNVQFNLSTERTSIKTTRFHAYIEVDILKSEVSEQLHITFSQSIEFDYHECEIRYKGIRKFSERFHKMKNTICYITFNKTSPRPHISRHAI